jgi:hypothetical protein
MIEVFWKMESRPIQWHQFRLLTRQLFFPVFTNIVYATETWKWVSEQRLIVSYVWDRRMGSSTLSIPRTRHAWASADKLSSNASGIQNCVESRYSCKWLNSLLPEVYFIPATQAFFASFMKLQLAWSPVETLTIDINIQHDMCLPCPRFMTNLAHILLLNCSVYSWVVLQSMQLVAWCSDTLHKLSLVIEWIA